MRYIYLSLLTCCLSVAGFAQNATDYVFSRSTTTVTDISGEAGVIAVNTINGDDATSTGHAIGFTFTYCGVDYTQLSVCSNGFLSLANSGSAPWTNSTGNLGGIGGGVGVLMPWWDDLNGSGKTAYILVSGTAPTRVFTFQYGSESNLWTRLGGGRSFLAQVKLYESSNVVEFLYGTNTGTGTASATIGISSSGSNYQTLPSLASSTTTTGFTTNLNGFPDPGSVLTFTPPPYLTSSPASHSFSTGVSTTSASEDITVAAYGLTSGFVTVNAPANFEVYNGSTWVSSMNIPTTPAGSGSYINTTFQVHFVAPGVTGPYAGNLTMTSAGAPTQTIALSGDALPMCSGTPFSGVVSATANSGACTPYSSDLSLSGATSGIGGLTYQWQSSPDDVAPYTDVVGATNETYTATVGEDIYYRAIVGCSVSGMSATTPGAAFTYTASPVAIGGTSTLCVNETTVLTNATPGGTWTSSNGAVATVVSGTGEVTGVSAGTAEIIYTVTASGCTATQTVTVNTSPTPIVVTPSTTAVCSGSSAMISASSSFPASSGVSSGSISVGIPDSNPTGSSDDLNVNLPAGAIITGVSVNFNITHTWVSDLDINLTAPNGNTLNLVNSRGGSGDNFINTTVSSAGGLSFGSSGAPFTGTFAADAGLSQGATAFVSNVTSFADLYSTPNGNWTLSMRDAFFGDIGTLTSWSLTIDYTIPPTIEWAPNTDLYTDAGMTTPYTGGGSGTLYAAPMAPGLTPVVTVYTLTTTVMGCSATATATVTTNPMPEAITGTLNACVSATSALSNATPGGAWSTSSAIATVDGAGLVTAGGTAGTTTVSYALGSCAATATFVVNAGPGVTTGTHTLCTGTTTTLSNPGGVGNWTSTNASVATVEPTTGVVTGITAGTAVISYSNGCGTDVGSVVTVNQTPGAISGPSIACVGGTTSLTNPDAGGTWSSSNTVAATIDAGSGLVTGVATGTTTIEYTLGNGCVNASRVQTVNMAPPAPTVTPATSVACAGEGTSISAISLVPAASSETSGSISVAIPDASATGASNAINVALPAGAVITGVSVNFNITHTWDSDLDINLTAPNGNTLNLVNSRGGSGDNFVNTTISSSSSTSLGSSSAPFTGTFAADAGSGQGPTAFTSNVTAFTSLYSVANGDWTLSIRDGAFGDNGTLTSWSISFEYDVPADIIWSPSAGLYTDAGLTTAYTGTTETSLYAAPDNTGSTPIETIYTTTATFNGCTAAATATVTTNPLPAAIGGDLAVCVGSTSTLTNADGGGTWSTGIPAIASIDMNTGVVTGVAAGLTDVTYTFTSTGCMRIANLTVNPLPAAILGATQLCEAGTTDLSNTDAGGIWSSGNMTIATVSASSGTVSGVMGGTAMISYTLPTGCVTTTMVNVGPLPQLTVTPTTATTFCIGESTSAYSAVAQMPSFSLLNQDFNNGLGGWMIQELLGASSGQWQIVASGFDGTLGDGTSMLQASPFVAGGQVQTRLVSPSFSTVGYTTATLTFNHFIISDASDAKAAVEYSTDGGSSWLPLVSYQNTVSGAGTWTSGTPDVTIPLPAGALGEADVRLRWDYDGAFYGWFLDNINVSTDLPAATYAWTGGSELSCTTCTNPTITPSASGANVYTVTATGINSCSSEGTVTINVNPLPAAIGGTLAVCEGLTSTLTNADGGGSWTSDNTAVATIDMNTGLMTGVAAGTANVTYTLPTGCIRAVEVTVNALPADITGTMDVCEGLTTTLANTTPAGTWSSSDAGVATVDGSGVVTGVAAGNADITFTITSTGCIKTADVTVNPLPAAITGTMDVCEGLTTMLDNADAGGSWTSSNVAAATIGLTSGVATGVAAGTSMITYTLPTGCLTETEITVNPVPAAITGTMDVCEGLTTALASATSGGSWTSSATATATIDATTGVVTAIAAGNTMITYMLPTGCIATAEVTVNPLPDVITGTMEVCEGLTTNLVSATSGGLWTSGSTATATVSATGGMVTGVSAGVADITYMFATGCLRTADVTVNPLPVASTGTMQVCEGSTTLLSNTDAGGTWSTSTAAVADISVSTGVVTGVSAGTATMTYMLPTGCITTDVVTVNPLPIVANVTGGGSYCFSGSGVNIGVDTSEAGTTYSLYTGGSIVGTQSGTGTAVDFGAYTAAGVYTVMASTAFGCEQDMTGDATVVIIPLVTPAVSISTTPGDTVCDGTAVTFTATPVNGGSTPVFDWRVNGTSMGATDTYSYTPADGDTISVTLTSSEACPSPASVMDEMNMVVVSNETPVVTVVVGPNDTICQHSMAVFAVTSVFGGSAPVYTWEVNGTPTGTTGVTYAYVPVDGDVVSCKLNSNYRCPIVNNVSSNDITMQVDSVYVPTVKIDADPGFDIQVNQSVTFTATVSKAGPNPTYQWFLNDMPITGATSVTYTVDTLSDKDSVSCLVYGTGDCSYFTFNSVIMGVSTGIATTSIMTDADIRLVPNPNTGEFLVSGTLATSDDAEVTLEVANMLGQVVYRNTVTATGGKLNERVQLVNNLSNGMYMLNVRSGAESSVFRFVLKQ